MFYEPPTGAVFYPYPDAQGQAPVLCYFALSGRALKKKADVKPLFKKPVPVFLQSVSTICNQLLRSGTSIGANNAEATNAVSKQDLEMRTGVKRPTLYLYLNRRKNGEL